MGESANFWQFSKWSTSYTFYFYSCAHTILFSAISTYIKIYTKETFNWLLFLAPFLGLLIILLITKKCVDVESIDRIYFIYSILINAGATLASNNISYIINGDISYILYMLLPYSVVCVSVRWGFG